MAACRLSRKTGCARNLVPAGSWTNTTTTTLWHPQHWLQYCVPLHALLLHAVYDMLPCFFMRLQVLKADAGIQAQLKRALARTEAWAGWCLVCCLGCFLWVTVAFTALLGVPMVAWRIGDLMMHIILHLAAGEQPDLPETLTALLLAVVVVLYFILYYISA